MNDVFENVLNEEIAKEKAEALARTEQTLRAALAAYRELAAPGSADAAGSEPRARRLWKLVEAVTSYVVQREACGLRDIDYVLEFYDVPAEAVARIGARPPADLR